MRTLWPYGVAIETGTIVFRSKRQQKVFDSHARLSSDRAKRRVKIIRQDKWGEILLHHFFYHEESSHWIGYTEQIGPLGGVRSSHDDKLSTCVYKGDDGELFLDIFPRGK